MHSGKAPKLAPSFMRRRIRLGISHHGSPSAWTAPAKDTTPDRRPAKKRR
jgi:hypothetical protein